MTLTEEQRGTVAFDLGKAREAVHTLENFAFASGKITAGQIQDVLWGARLLATSAAEIERLRAELEEAQESLTEAYLLGSHEKAQEMAARIKALERGSINQAAKIRELEAEIERLAQPNASDDWGNLIVLSVSGGEYRDVAPHQLTEEGKIGPDDSKKISHLRPYEVVAADLAGMLAQSWQITEERKETLRRALEEYKIFPNDQAVLRAMLQEAGQ
jgi:hypothetical protein